MGRSQLCGRVLDGLENHEVASDMSFGIYSRVSLRVRWGTLLHITGKWTTTCIGCITDGELLFSIYRALFGLQPYKIKRGAQPRMVQ
jgi:hypothetical protein